jgi:hypothetical protein
MGALGSALGVAIGVALASTEVAAQTRELEAYDVAGCTAIRAFTGTPTLEALRTALRTAGSRSAVRLDLHLPHLSPSDEGPAPQWKAPLEAARALAGSPASEAITELVLDGFPLSAEAARVLARSPHLGGVRTLSVGDTIFTSEALRELLAPGAFPALVELDLLHNGFDAADLNALAAGLAGRRIRRLAIGAGLELDQRGALDALARIAAVPSLVTLDFGETKLGFAGVKALLGVARTTPLEIVTKTPASLSRAHMDEAAALDPRGLVSFATAAFEVGQAGLRTLDASGLLAKITTLQLTCGDACVALLAKSARTGRLRELVVWGGDDEHLSKAAGEALAHATALGALRSLAFIQDSEGSSSPGIGAAGVRALARAPFARALETLALFDQNLDDAGWEELAGTSAFPSLKELRGDDVELKLTTAAARLLLRTGPLAGHLEVLRFPTDSSGFPLGELAKGLGMPRVRVLELPGVAGTKRAWMAFARSPGAQRLEALSIRANVDPGGEDENEDKAFRAELSAALRKSLGPKVCLDIGR